jgi:SH3-like domain-containing protein
VFLGLALATAISAAASEDEAGAAGPTGLPLPRFVSLRSNEVNLRTGPGVQYPIEWVYRRAGMPVEVIAEFDTWRKVRDWQGTVGWVHQSMLTGKRRALVTGGTQALRREPRDGSALVARLEPGVIGEIGSCGPEWCRVTAAGLRGWLKRGEFWGVYPNERFD